MSSRTNAFLEQLVLLLMPYFLGTSADVDAARGEIIETLASYGARARSEMLNAAQIIAFAMSALDTLADAAAKEMSPSMRLRFRGCANNLNRSCQQNEKTLARRLACDKPETAQPRAIVQPTDAPRAAATTPTVHATIAQPGTVSATDSGNARVATQVQDIVRPARSRLDTCRNRLANSVTVESAQAALKNQPNTVWGNMMALFLADQGISPIAVVSTSIVNPAAA